MSAKQALVQGGIELAKTAMTKVLEESAPRVSRSKLTEAQLMMRELKLVSVRERTEAQVREVDPDNFERALDNWRIDPEIRDTFREMADLMLRRHRRSAFKEFEYDRSSLKIKYAVCVGYRGDDGVFQFAYGKYECDAQLQKQPTGNWFMQWIGRGGQEDAVLDIEQRNLLMGTFVPHQVMTEMKNEGIINEITYEA